MHPVFHVGPIEFPAYFTLLIVGYTLVVLLGAREGERLGLDYNRLLDLGLILLAAGIVGARALHVVADEEWDTYRDLCVAPLQVQGQRLPNGKPCHSDQECRDADRGDLCHPSKGTCHVQDCLRVFKFWYGGLVFYGGLLLAIPTGLWFVRRHRMPTAQVADLAGFAIPLGLVFGRTGCFLAGCCWGRTCPTGFGGLAFPPGSAAFDYQVEQGMIARSATETLPVYPTQAWEAAACLAIFAYLYFWRRTRKRFDGQLFYLFLMLYAVARFVIEFWRDDPRGDFLGLATSQWLGIPLFAVGAALYARAWRKYWGARAGGGAR